MKAVVLKAFNQDFVLEDVNRPVPIKGQVLVRIRASGVNPLDLKIKKGQAAHAQVQPPAILGLDMAGTIEAVGEGVDPFRPGDAVYGMVGGVGANPGTLAEYVAADAALLACKPKNISFREAAAIPLAFITAWEALVDKAKIEPGQTVLIQGGAGGVGHLAVQIAVAKGANVFATVHPKEAERIKGYGAIPIDYTCQSVEEYIQVYTQGQGFDVILDTVGGRVLDDSFKAVKRYSGHVVSILGWGTHSLAPLSFRGATYSGVFTLYPLLTGQQRSHQGAILSQATRLIEADQLRPTLDALTYTLATVQQAYQAMEQRSSRGKVVIYSGDETTT